MSPRASGCGERGQGHVGFPPTLPASARLAPEALRPPSVCLAILHKRSRQICPPISVPRRNFRAAAWFRGRSCFSLWATKHLVETYLNDIQRQYSRFINPKPVRELLDDKLLFGTLVGPIARVPVNYLYADHGSTVVVSAEWHDIASGRTGKIYRLVNKRARGGGGAGIRFLEISQGIVRFSGREVELSAFVRSFAGRNESLLCQFIEQSGFCRKIYPDATNTLRVICMRERGGAPFVAKTILRLGAQRSKGVDNFGCGGLAAIGRP